MIKKMMGRLGVAEDEPIEKSMITKSLETAQTKIEGFHFDSRKHVLEFDDVLNIQRKAIYERRRKILMGDKADLETYIADVLGSDEDLKRQVDEREKVVGNEEFYNAARRLFLQTIDMYWVDHLEMMDYMRGSVNLRAYGQRDPLVEYKKEGLKMFKDMQESINGQIREMLPKIGAGAFKKEEEELKKTQENMRLIGASKTSDDKPKPVVAKEEVGRNDPCPCGSGKKYKKCHGA